MTFGLSAKLIFNWGRDPRMYKSFKEMPIWQEAMDIAEKIFYLTDNLPKKEDYGFTFEV